MSRWRSTGTSRPGRTRHTNRERRSDRFTIVAAVVTAAGLTVLASACGAAPPGSLGGTIVHLVKGSGGTGWRTVAGVVDVQPSAGKALVVNVNAGGRFGLELGAGPYIVSVRSPTSCAGTSVHVVVKSAAIVDVTLRCPH